MQKQLKLFYEMLRIRMVEEKIAELYSEWEMRCPVHLCIGQEAIPVGVCANLAKEDYVFSNHRSHGHYLAKGGDLNAMMAEIYGKATGCSKGKGGSMHLIDLSAGFLGATPIVASTIPIAVGTAFGSLMLKSKRVTVVFFGDGATEEGVLYESLNFAVLKRLPVIFVCENNAYSVYSPLSVRQPKGREIYLLAKSQGMDSYQGDGNDILEVDKLASQAIRKARKGAGPTFLEFKTYRWREHCGPNYDNELRYRKKSELKKWIQLDPIKRLRKKLISEGIISNQGLNKLASDLEAEICSAFKFAKESPFPEEQSLLDHVYAP
jgi:pyruvate dehydrogenase E1 component alpha subunit